MKIFLLLVLIIAFCFCQEAEEVAEEVDLSEENVKEVQPTLDREQFLKNDGYSDEQIQEIKSQSQSYQFQAEVNRVMSIIINSLYSNKEIFLRELISNASDALDKIRFLALSDPSLMKDFPDLEIRVKADPEKNVLHIIDTGIGMTKEDLISKLGTIAKSGTKEFLEAAKSKDVHQIGQFGVGFYSSYLVAERVVVNSKHPKDDRHIWESLSDNNFTIWKAPKTQAGEVAPRGTVISLYLKPDAKEYLQIDILEKLLTKYSEFIDFPIKLWKSTTVQVEVPAEPTNSEEDSTPSTKTQEETEWNWQVVNVNKPIWVREKSEVSEEDYNNFYKSFTKDTKDPITHVHFTGEGEVDFHALLYLPSQAPANFYENVDRAQEKSLRLYVRRVFITDDFTDLIPKYLSFVRGVVDADNIPLNVGREILQKSKVLTVLKTKLVKKILLMLQQLAKDEEKYLNFYSQFSPSLKLGVIEDSTNRQRLLKLLRFVSSKTGNLTSLDDYVSRLKPDQKRILYIGGESKQQIEDSPLIEKAVDRGYEVLYLVDPLDEWTVMSSPRYDDKYEFVSLAKEDAKFLDDEISEEVKRKQSEDELKPLIQFLEKTLGTRVQKVRVSSNLVTSPSAITNTAFSVSANQERVLRAQAYGTRNEQLDFTYRSKKVLELNANHVLVRELARRVRDSQDEDVSRDMALLLYDTAALHSGFTLEEPRLFASRIHKMMKLGLDIDLNQPEVEESSGEPDSNDDDENVREIEVQPESIEVEEGEHDEL